MSGAFSCKLFLAALVAASVLSPVHVLGQNDPDSEVCRSNDSSDDDTIASCTRVLARPALDVNDRARTLYNRGIGYSNKRDYDRAIRDYDEAIRLDPESARTYNNRGSAYLDKQDYDRAIRDYSEAIRLDSKHAKAYYNRGLSHSKKQDYDSAIRDYDQAIRLVPKDANAHNARGNAYQNKQDYDRAIRDYDEAIRLEPKDALAHDNRGLAYTNKRDYDRAIRDYDEAIRLDPKPARTYNNRGLAYANKRDYDRAIRDYDEAIRIDPNATSAPANRKSALAAREAAERPASPVVGRRVALVIGNSAYPGPARLPNPGNDADDVSAALAKLGFEVIAGKDLTLTGFSEKIAAFGQKAAGAEVALFYYAGHGMQFEEQNWLLPVDARAKSLFEARRQYVSLSEATSEIEARAGTMLVFLDACRDNPLEAELKANLKAQGRGYGETRGLAPPEIRSPQTLVVFATRPNTTAADGGGRNSPFTEAFLKHVATPGVEVEVLMKRVTAMVVANTSGKQRPERLSRLEQEFYFVPSKQ